MGAHLDLDDVAAGHPQAMQELAALRKDAERYRKWRAAFTSVRDEDVMYKLADAWELEAVDAVLDAAIARGAG